ncbi:Glycosyl transferase, family 11 [Candidatus Nanopelagicaceae bacterium]
MGSSLAIEMRGGLGNQLFIYSAGMYFAHSVGTQPKFFMRGISTTSESIEGLLPGKYVSGKCLTSRIQESYVIDFQHIGSRKLICEQIGLHPDDYVIEKRSLLKGFFQDREFPMALEREGFDFGVTEWPISDWTIKFIRKIQRENATVIHIRRGDYLNHINSLGVLSDSYYEKAIKIIEPAPMYIISDSPSQFEGIGKPNWAKHAEIVKAPKVVSDVEILVLLSQAPNLVLANSSFSWWGAFLSKSSGKKIAPGTWFRDNKENLKIPNIHMSEWELLDSEWINQ